MLHKIRQNKEMHRFAIPCCWMSRLCVFEETVKVRCANLSVALEQSVERSDCTLTMPINVDKTDSKG